MSLQEAVEAPRIWSQGQELEVEQDVPAAVRDGLAARGHLMVAVGGVAGGMNAVQFNPDGTPIGVSGGLARPGSRFRPDANRRAT
jgi:gamma-glutamyltranspeptidase/glutathione hydrolase